MKNAALRAELKQLPTPALADLARTIHNVAERVDGEYWWSEEIEELHELDSALRAELAKRAPALD